MPSVEAYWASLQPPLPGRSRFPARSRRVVATLGWVATASLVLVALALVALRLAGWRPLTIVTGSMAPTLRAGDLVLVSPERADAARAGEVVSFAHPLRRRSTITHRVVRVRRGRGVPDGWLAFTTRGDANRAAEHWLIPANGMLARVRARVPVAGRLLLGGARSGLVTLGATIAVSSLALWLLWPPVRRR